MIEQFRIVRGTVVPLTAKYKRNVGENVIDETDHEYRINLLAEDRRNIDAIIASMEPLFAST